MVCRTYLHQFYFCFFCLLLASATEGLAARQGGRSKPHPLPKNFHTIGEESRVKALASWFAPTPEEMLQIDSPEKQKMIAGRNLPPQMLKGYIRVTPPAGQCIVIERRTQESDPSAWRPPVKVCKAQDVSFSLGEMDEFSELTWLVRTDSKDQGTRLVWTLPYRIAFVIPYNVPLPTDPEPFYILGCQASYSSDFGRRVFVNTFSGERWYIRFPKHDQMVDPGPVIKLDDGTTPLVKNGFGYRSSHSRAAKRKRKEEAMKAAMKSEINAEPIVESKEDPFEPTDFAWKISRFDTFKVSADAFMPNGAVTPGMNGECRYTYETVGAEFPSGGLIECHGADRYAYLYLPLNCLSDPGFRRVKKIPPPPPPTPKPTPVVEPAKH